MNNQIGIVKGFQDVLVSRSRQWSRLEDTASSVFGAYGFFQVRLPLLEKTELFARGIGESTDIVDKEMYTFPDRKGRSLSLRPEATASVVRAYLSSGKGRGEKVKWHYRGPMFRYERPQKGRYRQFHQIGAEAIGYPGPGTDAEVLSMLERFFKEAGIKNLRLELNSLGCKDCRPGYRDALVAYLEGKRDGLCEECNKRIGRNPLRALDCKVKDCKKAVAEAPVMVDFICPDCTEHFDGLRKDLETTGVIYVINPRIVRGLDYYSRTVFEYIAETGLGSQDAVAAGGRYDGLVEEFGGPPTPAIGFAIGMERAALLMEEDEGPVPRYFIAAIGEAARVEGLGLALKLRGRGLWTEMLTDEKDRSLRSQMKAASKAGAGTVIVIGEEELDKGVYTFKDMETGEQVQKTVKEWMESRG